MLHQFHSYVSMYLFHNFFYHFKNLNLSLHITSRFLSFKCTLKSYELYSIWTLILHSIGSFLIFIFSTNHLVSLSIKYFFFEIHNPLVILFCYYYSKKNYCFCVVAFHFNAPSIDWWKIIRKSWNNKNTTRTTTKLQTSQLKFTKPLNIFIQNK